MRLVIRREVPHQEIVHFADDETLVASHHHRVFIAARDRETVVRLPESPLRRAIGVSRIARRALRLDKCNVVPVGEDRTGYVILRNRAAFHFDITSGRLTETLRLSNCRNVLHGSIAVIDREVIFGEYGSIGKIAPVPIHRSVDGGLTWARIDLFPAGTIRHVHGCYWDPYEERIWTFTGDSDEEARVITSDTAFTRVELVGGGSQLWRAVSVFFEEQYVHWMMDSEREDSYAVRFDRRTRTVERGQKFPGPVWYTKKTTDGLYLAASTCEKGAGVHDEYAHLFVSRDLEKWDEVARFAHDRLPKGWFKFGVLSFADGAQSSRKFYLSGEALDGLDGRAIECALEDSD